MFVPVLEGDSLPGFVLSERRKVKGAQPHANGQARTLAPDPGHDLAQEAGAVLKAAAVGSGPGIGAQELVAQVAVAVLDVDESQSPAPEPALQPAQNRRSALRSRRRSSAADRDRCQRSWPAGDCDRGSWAQDRLWAGQSGRNGSIAGRPADRRWIHRWSVCSCNRALRSCARPPRVLLLIINWLGLARPSGRTATASPPQISLAPLRPKFFQRRRYLVRGQAIRRTVPTLHGQDRQNGCQ